MRIIYAADVKIPISRNRVRQLPQRQEKKLGRLCGNEIVPFLVVGLVLKDLRMALYLPVNVYESRHRNIG